MCYKHLFTMAVAALTFTAAAQTITEQADTVKVIKDAQQITIQKTADGNSIITVNGTKTKDDYYYQLQVSKEKDEAPNTDGINIGANFPFSQKSKKKLSYDVAKNMYFGITVPTGIGSPLADDAVSTSYEVGIGQVAGITYKPLGDGFSISTGLGFGMRQFSIKNTYLLHSGLDRRLEIVEKTKTQNRCKSRISSAYLQIPVMFTQKIYKSFGVSLGAIVNFNTYTIATIKYRDDEEVDATLYHEETYKGLHQRLVTVDFMATIGSVDNIGIFVRYSPMKMFENGYGPEIKSLTTGITLNF